MAAIIASHVPIGLPLCSKDATTSPYVLAARSSNGRERNGAQN
jgi:hypothetical protein